MPSTDQRLESLLEVAALLSSELEPAKVLTTIMELAARVAEAETASLLLVDPDNGELYFDVALGLAPEVQKLRLKPGQGIAGFVAQTGKAALVADVSQDPHWDPTMDERSGFRTRSILAVPMRGKERVLGVIEVVNKRRGRFGEQDRRVLEAFAAQAGIALENARLFSGLRAEKARFEAVLSEMSEAAVVTDAWGRVLLANPATRHLLDRTPRPGSPLADAFEDFRAAPTLAALLAAPREERFEAVRETPKTLHLAGTVRRLSGETPQGPERRLWVFRDVTEERREEALKQEFFSLISHKLKTPLVSVLGFCELLTKDPSLGESQRKSIGVVLEKSRRLSALVDKLLKFTWLHGMRAAGLKKEAVSVDRLLRHAARPFELEIDDGLLVLERGEGLETEVRADGKLVSDALGYLIENAMRFNPKPKKRVRVSAQTVNGNVEVRVEDDGPGIPPEDRPRVFKKFYQVEERFTGQVEGWGLGLPFVDQAMRAHGGSVRLESKLGKGTTVVLVFPEDAA